MPTGFLTSHSQISVPVSRCRAETAGRIKLLLGSRVALSQCHILSPRGGFTRLRCPSVCLSVGLFVCRLRRLTSHLTWSPPLLNAGSTAVSNIDQWLLWNSLQNLTPPILLSHSDPLQAPAPVGRDNRPFSGSK